MPVEDADAVNSKVQGALDDALGDEREMVTRWVCVVETLDRNGHRALWHFAQKGSMPWDILGMVDYVWQMEMAATIRAENGG